MTGGELRERRQALGLTQGQVAAWLTHVAVGEWRRDSRGAVSRARIVQIEAAPDRRVPPNLEEELVYLLVGLEEDPEDAEIRAVIGFAKRGPYTDRRPA